MVGTFGIAVLSAREPDKIITARRGSPIVIGVGDADLLVGTVITAFINFLAVAAVCFLIVKAYDKWQKKDEAAAGPSEIDLLTEIRDSLRNR